MIDDTSCTNYFGQSFFVIIIIDENLNDQELFENNISKRVNADIAVISTLVQDPIRCCNSR